jgi:hypothetical protein
MKISIYLMALIMFFASAPVVQAQEYGKIRALRQRADDVVRLRNDFVLQVLKAYAIPYEQSAKGAVLRINVDDKWLDITGIEIIPILQETADQRKQVIAHEIFFYTASGVLDLMSELTIR